MRFDGDFPLRTLNLRNNEIGDQGFASLSEAVAAGAMACLERLFVNKNGISNTGLIGFADALKSKKICCLKELASSLNKIGDPGLTVAAAAIKDGFLPGLIAVDMAPNPASAEAQDALQQIVNKQALRTGELRGGLSARSGGHSNPGSARVHSNQGSARGYTRGKRLPVGSPKGLKCICPASLICGGHYPVCTRVYISAKDTCIENSGSWTNNGTSTSIIRSKSGATSHQQYWYWCCFTVFSSTGSSPYSTSAPSASPTTPASSDG